MIQRIQSVWLLLAALVMASIFYFPTYSFSGTSAASLTIGNDFLGIILAAISIILSLVTIFRFKKQKKPNKSYMAQYISLYRLASLAFCKDQ